MKSHEPLRPAAQPVSAALGSNLIQRKCGCGGSAGLAGKCDECQKQRLTGPRKSLAPQFKLTVSQPRDPQEQQADQIADRIMRSPQAAEPVAVNQSPASSELKLQRKRLKEDDEIKGKWNDSPGEVTPDVADHIRGLSGGQPLAASERNFFKPWFNHSFEDVRVHTDKQANETAQALNARAFTLGNDIVFASDQYSPGTNRGRRLLAHELTHVVQQRAGPATIHRDLATPPPAVKNPKKPDLSAAEIAAAIAFNKARYDERSTREIQDLVGSKPTGIWVELDIKLIALLQEEFGVTKNGQVDVTTFKFLDNEVRLEKLSKTDEKHCLLSFSVVTQAPVVGPVTAAGTRSITAKFNMSARFSEFCGCSDYEYRQYIRGHWKRERGGVVTDLGGTFTTEPAGRLNEAFDEDGNTSTAALNYGHRTQTAEAGNQYSETDHATGCVYEGEDNPGGPDDVQSGDVFDIDVNFRGDIERKGTVVGTKSWTAIKGRFPVP